jgi:hypothetical protein
MSGDGWHEAKKAVLAKMQVTKSHDELIRQLGPAYQLIKEAGFVIVPKKWRDDLITLCRLWQITK